MHYLMLVSAAVLFSLQFLFNQKFEEENGTSVSASMKFTLYSSLAAVIILLALNGFNVEVSGFSVLMAFMYGVIGILYNVVSIKALGHVNLSAFSVFAMLGGMLLPSVYGIIFCGEGASIFKVLCYVLMIVSVVLTINTKDGVGNKLYYMGVFVLNGLVGVVSVIHQKGASCVDSISFLIIARFIATVLSFGWCLISKINIKKISLSSIGYSLGFAAFCGIGNLFVLIALKHISASVQYPIITGGVIVISTLISVLRKEKLTHKNICATAIAFVSTVLIAI